MKRKKIYPGFVVFFIGIILSFGAVCLSWADEGPVEEMETEDSAQSEMARSAKQKNAFRIVAGVDVAYDNNVFNYSDSDKDEYDDNTNPDRFRGVDSLDDYITRIYAIVRMKDEIFDFGSTTSSIGVKTNIYAENSEKTYVKLQTSVRQRIGEDHFIRFGYDFLPRYYVRTLYVRDEPVGERYKKAEFLSNGLHVKYWNAISEDMSWWLRYSYEHKTYGSHFTERDTNSHRVTASTRIMPVNWLKFSPYSRYFWNFARGRSGKDNTEPDISRNGFDVGTDIWFYPMDKLSFLTGYDFRWQYYTTSQDTDEDPYHSGRRQGRHRVTGRLNYAFKKDINFFVEYQYETRDVDIEDEGTADVTLKPEAILGYDKHLGRVGLAVRF